MLTAMATAFHDDGSVDLDGTARIAAHLVDHGHDGVVVCGTTGESPDHHACAEDGEILRAVKDAVGDRADRGRRRRHQLDRPLASSWPEQAEKLGADGLLLVTPYYNKPGQAGVLHHFRSVVEATDVPVMLYDVPGRTGTQIAPRDLRAADQQWDTVVAVKDAVGDFARGVKIMQMGYAVYSGDDAANLGWLAHGAARRRLASSATRPATRLAGDDRRLPRRRPRRPPSTIYTRLLPAIDAVMGVAQLRSHHRQGSTPAARRPRQPQRPRPARAARRRRGRRAARRPRRLRPPLRRNPLEPPPSRALRTGRAAEGGLADHPARRARRGRPQHDRLRVRRPAADRRLRRAVPRGQPPRRRPDPPRLRRRSGTGSTRSRRWCSPTATRTTSAPRRTSSASAATSRSSAPS